MFCFFRAVFGKRLCWGEVISFPNSEATGLLCPVMSEYIKTTKQLPPVQMKDLWNAVAVVIVGGGGGWRLVL